MDSRVFERGLVIHGVRIEQDQVRKVAVSDHPTFVDLEALCRVLGNALDHLFERPVESATEPAYKASKAAESPWVDDADKESLPIM